MKQTQLLERLYAEVEKVILNRQHPVTGLLPASTAINNHGDYTDAWVRDNVYSIMSVWSLGLAFKRQGEEHKADHLLQATIKLMRGLMQSMMRQSHKVEAFKYSLQNKDSLHAKYDTATGLPVVADDAWGHLQIDATSLYLLMLAQMSASGLRIICTPDEVDFVQNLVYYISSAYRTPDYGIWERGNKVNNGKTEINASSVGMAKAALQALDGFNLFGPNGDKRGVIHVIADAISLARTTLASLLPRESLSKETDSALLSIIGFPAFAVGKESLATQTRDTVLTKLGGNYGCKRFLWDGHQTVLEESSRIYYNLSELVNFAHIESEWPLFFTYLYITALFDGSEVTAKHYRKKLESLMVNIEGVGLLPELYYLPKENVEAEKKNPRSQTRVPNDNLPLVWAQSLFYTGLMLDEGLVSTDDIDPLMMRRRSTKFIKSNIALVVLAENDKIKQHLAKNGVIAESLQDIKPMAVVSASGLMETYAHIGENKTLGLTGRPRRRVQSLATSQTYEINNRIYLCLSWMQSEREDYRMYDALWLSQSLEAEIHFIYKNWISSEVAVFTLMMDHRLYKIPNAAHLFQTLRNLQLRTEIEYVGYASANLAYRASRVNRLSIPYFHVHSLTNTTLAVGIGDESINPEHLEPVARMLLNNFDTESEIFTYRKFSEYVKKRKMDDLVSIPDAPCTTLLDLMRDIYLRAQKNNYWLISRFCFSQFNYSLNDLTDSLTLLAARNLVLCVGDNDYTEIQIDQSFSNSSYFEGVRQLFPDVLERTLVQEVLSAIGSLIRSEPMLFDSLHSVQLRNFLLLCAMDKGDAEEVSLLEWLGLQSPAKIFNKIRNVLSSRKHVFSKDMNFISPYKIHHHDSKIDENPLLPDTNDTDWLEWRIARGLITHFDKNFLQDIWHSLMFCEALVFGNPVGSESRLDCEITRSSMTPGEVNFAHLIDHVTHQLYPHYYKAAVVEALYAYTQFCINHPDKHFSKPLVFKDVIAAAAKRFVDEASVVIGKRTHESDLNLLLQQTPHVLNLYVSLVYADLTKPD